MSDLSLSCFKCSELQTRAVSCPGPHSDHTAWMADPDKVMFTSVSIVLK